ncbi:MAG TPA: hypothetical protein VH593_12415 [Ktedonobacteraceae bacterium]|jgi:hypothetical protein
MSEPITQMRLSMRLERYLSEYVGKNTRQARLYTEEWDTAWQEADAARARKTLTPELVDDVRIALEKL